MDTPALEVTRVAVNGIHLHTVMCGPPDAQPIVLLHGFPEGWLSWRKVMLSLGTRYRVVAPDLRGYGGSDKPASGYDVVTLSDDVDCLMEALGLEQPVLVGHDWGGAVGWIYGHRLGARIKHLVVVNCTHPKTLLRGIVRGTEGQTLRSLYMLPLQIPGVAERLLTANHGALLTRGMLAMEGAPGAMDRALLDELVSRFKSPADLRGPLTYYREIALAQVHGPSREALRFIYGMPIACPVTVLWGDRDVLQSQQVARLSDQDAGCPVDFRVLPGVGHFVSLEAPEVLTQALTSIVDGLENPQEPEEVDAAPEAEDAPHQTPPG